MTKPKANRYEQIIERIFMSRYHEGTREIMFEREDIERVAKELRIKLPKNLGDVIYSFRYRVALPEAIRAKAPQDETWIIRPAGRSRYCFAAVPDRPIIPNKMMSETKVPDSTPGIVLMYSFDDEQALLAKVRYNRLIDIFTGITCYSLQNHLRTHLSELGQIETDEIYVGVDKKGMHYVFPVQAKGGKDKLNIVQIEQDIALCKAKFPTLICRAIGAQFVEDNLIALFEFEEGEMGIALSSERHYRLVPPENITSDDLDAYRSRTA
ncbi:MAG TPA: endonuclease [Blastocatellia bacterium]|nr:endonuclease [Blastocatellia bacterium]